MSRFHETAEQAYDRMEREWEDSMDGATCEECTHFAQVCPEPRFAELLARELDSLMVPRSTVVRPKDAIIADAVATLRMAQEYHGWCTAVDFMTTVDTDVDGCEWWEPAEEAIV